MFVFGEKSNSRLAEVHPDLARVARHAIKISKIDFSVTEGIRTRQRQQALVASGASQTMDSRHLTGHAIDLAPYIDGTIRWDWPLFYIIADAMRAAAIAENVPIRWGGAWDTLLTAPGDLDAEDMSAAYVANRKQQGRKPFLDGPHFELPKDRYPAT